MKSEYEKRNGVKKFSPVSTSPTPWHVVERDLWHRVVAANGKTVCNCRNILDAEQICKAVNTVQP